MSKGINFKKLRNDAGLTLAHLAELSGYDVTDIVRLEQGVTKHNYPKGWNRKF